MSISGLTQRLLRSTGAELGAFAPTKMHSPVVRSLGANICTRASESVIFHRTDRTQEG
jgi:hypothetical protein